MDNQEYQSQAGAEGSVMLGVIRNFEQDRPGKLIHVYCELISELCTRLLYDDIFCVGGKA